MYSMSLLAFCDVKRKIIASDLLSLPRNAKHSPTPNREQSTQDSSYMGDRTNYHGRGCSLLQVFVGSPRKRDGALEVLNTLAR